jgi:hypothetical protein
MPVRARLGDEVAVGGGDVAGSLDLHQRLGAGEVAL